MKPIILIPARLAATRLPNKPLADINGKPMIVHVWERAVASGVGEVAVATDNENIFQAIEKTGGKAVMTREDHPSGSDRIFEALQKIDPGKKHDIVINMQGDMPTFDPKILASALEPLKDPSVDIATLAAQIVEEEEKTNPNVVKVVARGTWQVARNETTRHVPRTTCHALYFTRATAPHGDGPLYHHIGIYAYRRAALEKFVSLPPSPLEKREKLEQLRALEAGMRIGVSIVDTVPLGVDTEEQLEKARKLMSD